MTVADLPLRHATPPRLTGTNGRAHRTCDGLLQQTSWCQRRVARLSREYVALPPRCSFRTAEYSIIRLFYLFCQTVMVARRDSVWLAAMCDRPFLTRHAPGQLDHLIECFKPCLRFGGGLPACRS